MEKILNKLFNRSTRFLSLITIVSLLVWTFGLPFGVNDASADALTDISVTLSDSDVSPVTSTQTIQFTTSSAISAGSENGIIIDFPSGFDISTASASCGVGAGSSVASQSASSQRIECIATGGGIGAGALVVTVTGVVNHATPGSYVYNITTNDGLASEENGQAVVAIIDDVTVTAAVNASLTFTIAGVGSGQNINGETVTTSSGATATALPFGILASASGPKVLAQQLSVSTNAVNGFTVTVFQDTNLLSDTGADIDLFNNGANGGLGTATPEAWVPPSAAIGSEETYGHYGITSEDSVLSTGDEFGAALYAGNLTTAREVFYHNGAADGTTAGVGLTRVAIKIQVSDLQEAASDYTNTLTYVATPVF